MLCGLCVLFCSFFTDFFGGERRRGEGAAAGALWEGSPLGAADWLLDFFRPGRSAQLLLVLLVLVRPCGAAVFALQFEISVCLVVSLSFVCLNLSQGV